jgi:hypothetical protein
MITPTVPKWFDQAVAQDDIGFLIADADDAVRSESPNTPRTFLESLDVSVEDDAAPEPKRKRRRKPNVSRFFKQARKAGETGTVRVSITDPNGYTITVASGDEPKQTLSNPWDEVSKGGKRATH